MATGLTFERAYVCLTFALLVASNSISLAAYWKIAGSASVGSFWTAAQIGGFLWLQDAEWLYLWDLIDMVVMPMFVYAIYSNVSISSYVALFIVGFLNRDSGFYIPAWLIFAALTEAIGRGRVWPGRWSPSENRRLLAGVTMAGAGVVIQQLLTRALFAHESSRDPQNHPRLGDLFWQPSENLEALWAWADYRANIALATIVLLAIWCLWQRRTPESWSLAMLVSLMLTTTIMFARLTETRVLFQFLPFVVLYAAYLRDQGGARAAAPV